MSFALDVSKFVEKAKKNPEKVMRQVSIKLFSAIIKATPVDTGRARNNWFASGSTLSQETTTYGAPQGTATIQRVTAATIQRVTAAINTATDWREFTLTNNLPYIQRLEYGWSKQAPAGMVRVNVARFQQLINEEANKVK